jgi:hypothetical protein
MPEWFLAWVEPTETSFTQSHQVMAEDVFSIQIDGREGEVAVLTLVLKNPRIGLLNAGRKLWIWLSWSDGTNTFPVFFGRLVGIPENVFGNLVSLVFLAKPLDFDQQRFDLAQGLKDLPWFDAIFVDSRLWDDPDAITETRSIRWQCTRGEDGTPLVVSTSDILEGEDGIEIFTADEVPKDSISLTISGAPLQSISVKAPVTWTQTGLENVPALQIPMPGGGQLNGFNESVFSDWPKPGASLGGGWAAAGNTSTADLAGAANAYAATITVSFQNREKTHSLGDVMSSTHTLTYPVGPIGVSRVMIEHVQQGLVWPGGGYGTITTNWHTVFDGEGENDDPDINIPYHYDATWLHIVFWRTQPSLAITAEAGVIKRTESVTFTMTADLQAVLSLPDPVPTSPKNPIETPGADVGAPIVGEEGTIAEATPPIGDTTLANYYPTPRGILSLENRLLWARAQLRQGARVAQSSWTIPFERALNLSCRKSARLVWDNMPGGQIEGKIIAYQIVHNVETGHRSGTVTIGATPGHDGTTTEITNSGSDYIEEDYIEAGHFVNSDDVVLSDSSLADFGYSTPIAETSTGEFPLKLEDVLLGVQVTGDTVAQANILSSILGSYYQSPLITSSMRVPRSQLNPVQEATNAIKAAIDSVKTQMTIQLVPIAGESGFESNYPIEVTPLRLPMTVNFEAPSNI